MKKQLRNYFLAALSGGALLSVGAGTATNWDAAGKAWWKNIEYLASDKLQGRNVGSPGFEMAADYVSAQFEKAGLRAAGSAGYFQRVDFTETSLNSSSLALVRDGRTTPVGVPEEAHLGYSAESPKSLEAPVVFAGYGLVIPEAHHNDLEGLPVKGAIVAYLTGGPDRIDGNLRSHYSSGAERWKALRAAGAVGVISIANPKSMEIPWARQSLAWGLPRVTLADPALVGTRGMKFSAAWDPAKANDLLAGSGHSFEEILEAADRQEKLPHFAVPGSIEATVSVSSKPIVSKNVVGLRPGDDPQLKDEYVVVSAHLDHLGVGKPVNGDSIYNGAMDDASGVASVIEIAKALQTSHVSTKRSILFLTVTGEEKGELGSIYFAAHPTVQGRIIADLNMDMFLPLFPLKWLEVQGLGESTLGDDVRAVAQAAGVQVQADKEPNHNRFIRSDQYSFIKKGIPALAFKFGYIPGGPDEKIFKDWYTHRYHGVTDDLKQPVDLAAAAQFNDILKNLAIRVADAAQPPHWEANSFFRRFEKQAE
ncbi:MAG TPA: M28 family peptidase [Bryobacteraceae bacterium]